MRDKDIDWLDLMIKVVKFNVKVFFFFLMRRVLFR